LAEEARLRAEELERLLAQQVELKEQVESTNRDALYADEEDVKAKEVAETIRLPVSPTALSVGEVCEV
jgi:hypothetical protein